ncbi:MAG: hypothetical protein R3344_07965 [Acidobacteriota bacterium]|nr:hypothetical protein [Acidobacteriota bacterium]
MAIPRWVKWTAAVVVVFGLLFAGAIVGGLYLLSFVAAPQVTVGEPLPAIELASLGDGEPIELEGYRGQVVVLDFWASW